MDTQNAMSFLEAGGHEFVADPAKADCIIVNTCGFINDAKEESINTILEMAEYKQKNCKYLIVIGCLVQRYLEELKEELPEVDLFIPIQEYKNMETIFNQFFHTTNVKQPETILATPGYWAYLRIADGCSNRCAYCAIPLIRKDYVSVPFEEVIAEAKVLESYGVKELNLIAQDTTRYGKDLYNRFRLHELLIELNKMNFKWIRILYMYPDEIYDGLLETMASLDKVIPYFDIPTQHGSDRMLLAMNRRGLQKDIIEVVDKIREIFPQPILRTTTICGFPTETDEDHQILLDFTKRIRWDRLGAFTYSLEEDTPAYDMEPKVSEEVANQRLDELMTLQSQISYENNQRYLGQSIEVLVENYDALHKMYQGRGRMHAPDDIDGHVKFTSEQPVEIGEMVQVKIDDVAVYDLFGKAV